MFMYSIGCIFSANFATFFGDLRVYGVTILSK